MTWYVLTTHPTEFWVSIQKRYFDRFLLADCVTMATVPKKLGVFDHEFADVSRPVKDVSGNHQRNLNLLTAQALKTATDKDVLVIFDGDAFPVAPLEPVVEKHLKEFPVLSIEHSGKKAHQINRIHCSFAAIHVSFWRRIGVDWGRAHSGRGGVNDTNGALVDEMLRRGIKWATLWRTNHIEPHYPMFGVYGNAVYHHGAGFRPATSLSAYERRIARLLEPEDFEGAKERMRVHKRYAWDRMMEAIRRDFKFYEQLAEI